MRGGREGRWGRWEPWAQGAFWVWVFPIDHITFKWAPLSYQSGCQRAMINGGCRWGLLGRGDMWVIKLAGPSTKKKSLPTLTIYIGTLSTEGFLQKRRAAIGRSRSLRWEKSSTTTYVIEISLFRRRERDAPAHGLPSSGLHCHLVMLEENLHHLRLWGLQARWATLSSFCAFFPKIGEVLIFHKTSTPAVVAHCSNRRIYRIGESWTWPHAFQTRLRV